MTKRLIRYLIYLGYFLVVGGAWLALLIFGFGFIPVPHERACDISHSACPEPSFIVSLATIGSVFGIVPLTVVGFVLLRKGLHRWQRIE